MHKWDADPTSDNYPIRKIEDKQLKKLQAVGRSGRVWYQRIVTVTVVADFKIMR